MLGKKDKFYVDQLILKIVVNFWAFLTMTFFIVDFFSFNTFDTSASAIGVIYIAILGIYTSEKEYTRWKSKFKSRFIGEGFILIWTIIMAMFIVIAQLSKGTYIVPEGFALVYTAIIGIFAITHHSKNIKRRK